MHAKHFAYEKHVLVCVNERTEPGKDHCAKVGGQEIYEKIKSFVKERGLTNRIWVTRTRCLGFCNPVGTTIVVYPDGKWFLNVTKGHVDEFIEQELA
jgi:(2Fe-2S) ferredoxin